MNRFAVVVAALLVVAAGSLWAQSSSTQMSGRSIESITADIRTQLNLGPNDPIDPNHVPQPLMIELGDAVMDKLIPNQQQHEWMDQMMGGEGSTSLDSMHSWLAYRYLTGGGGGLGQGGMMGGGFGMMGSPYGMMGNPGVPYAAGPYQSPETIAKDRYARGLITRDQYDQIMRDLQK